MWKKLVVYVLLITATLYLYFMYDNKVLSGVLVMEALYPFLSFLTVRLAERKLLVFPGHIPSMGECKKKIPIGVCIENKSALWQAKYHLWLSVKYHHSGKKVKIRLAGVAEPKRTQELYCEAEPDYCGMLEVALETVEIYDILGIFYKKKKVSGQKTVGIMPRFSLLPVEITRRTRDFPADAEDYSLEKGGNDPTETYQIREYRTGDSIHEIHWKLTAKEDALMVKERALPLGCAVLIWLDFSTAARGAASLDGLIEKAAALSMTLISEKCVHMAAWFEEKNERVVKWRIDSEKAVYEFIWRILSLEPFKDQNLKRIYYEDAFRGVSFSSIVQIDGKGRTTVNGKEQELLQI